MCSGHSIGDRRVEGAGFLIGYDVACARPAAPCVDIARCHLIPVLWLGAPCALCMRLVG